LRGREVAAQLRLMAMAVLSDRRMPEGVKSIIEKVRLWTRSGGVRRTCDQSLCINGYGR
jgi:hypothetical protein